MKSAIDTDRGGRRHSKIRERRITPADAGQAVENVANLFALSGLLQTGAGVGHHDKLLACAVASHLFDDAREKVLFEDVRLERAP